MYSTINKYIYIIQSASIHVSPFYASSVQLRHTPFTWLHCIYTRQLALTKRTRYNATQPCGHALSIRGLEGSNDLKRSGLCIIAFRHLLRSTKVLNNTEVKGYYRTICRHACFGVLRLISTAGYTFTHVAALHLYM